MATQATIDVFGIENMPHVRVALIDGRLDESNMSQLQEKIDPLILDPEVKTLVLNCKSLFYINSKIVGYLASSYSTMAERGGKIIIAEANEGLLDIIHMVGLTMIIEQAATMEEAMAMIGATPEQVFSASKKPASPEMQEAKPAISMTVSQPKTEKVVPQKKPPKDFAELVAETAQADALEKNIIVPLPIAKPVSAAAEPAPAIKVVSLSETENSQVISDKETKPESDLPGKIEIPKIIREEEPAEQSMTMGDGVTIMLELPNEAGVNGDQIYRTHSGSVEARLIQGDSMGKRIEITFKPGKYFFKGKVTGKRIGAQKNKKKLMSMLPFFSKRK